MNSLVDSHAHFDGADHARLAPILVRRAADAGVGQIVAVGGCPETNRAAIDAARRFPLSVFAALGYDREQARASGGDDNACRGRMELLEALIEECRRGGIPVVAVGETGLDFHYSADTAPEQIALFRAQLALARRLALPVIVHTREAEDATLDVLREHVALWEGDARRIGVVHCFTGSLHLAECCVALGFHVGLSGIITFANAEAVRSVATALPGDCLLAETDTPYLAPAPHRGEKNEPAFLSHVVQGLADVRGIPLETAAALTADNARRLFDLPVHGPVGVTGGLSPSI